MSHEKLQTCFKQALGLPDTIIIPKMQYGVEEQWDSLGHMQLIAALEKTFNIMVDPQDVLDMSSYEKAVEILKKYGVSFDA